jgi:hypothetical protein
MFANTPYLGLQKARTEFDLPYEIKKRIVNDYRCKKLNYGENNYDGVTVESSVSSGVHKEIVCKNKDNKYYEIAGVELDTMLNGMTGMCAIQGGRRKRSRKVSKKRRNTRRHRKSRRHH